MLGGTLTIDELVAYSRKLVEASRRMQLAAIRLSASCDDLRRRSRKIYERFPADFKIWGCAKSRPKR
jgi:hypothetical protein